MRSWWFSAMLVAMLLCCGEHTAAHEATK